MGPSIMSMSVTHKVVAAIMDIGRAVVVGMTFHHAAKYKMLWARNIGESCSGGARLSIPGWNRV